MWALASERGTKTTNQHRHLYKDAGIRARDCAKCFGYSRTEPGQLYHFAPIRGLHSFRTQVSLVHGSVRTANVRVERLFGASALERAVSRHISHSQNPPIRRSKGRN